ncbi:MAG: thrombospondin type 3 repeat-containing protein [Myxococcota bacterium]|nr:thrombospondin type 3 repeat-containing protein [Myxococcota bacterium]
MFAAVGISSTAHAQATLLIDTAPQPDAAAVTGCNQGVSVHIRTSTNIAFTRLEGEIDPTAAGNAKFVIWDLSTGDIVHQTPAQAVVVGRQFVVADLDTNATLGGAQPFLAVPGGEYHVALMLSGCGNWFQDTATTENSNGIETRANGGIQATFASPNEPPNSGLPIDARIRITGFLDLDGDGISNSTDNCPVEPNFDQLDKDSDGQGDTCDNQDNRDLDNDLVFNVDDNCPFDANANQADKDNDGLGDACDPKDDRDFDGDGVFNLQDNCPFAANADQADDDDDSAGDACDDNNGNDVDDDGDPNAMDNCPFVENPDQADADMDGVGDACDGGGAGGDTDNDGVANAEDNCPFAANPGQTDADGDGQGDECDLTIIVDGSGCATHRGNSLLFTFVLLGLALARRRRTARK